MSNSNQDSGIFGAVAAIGLLLLCAAGFFYYQRMRTVQMLVQSERLRAEMQKEEAVVALKAAEAARSLQQATGQDKTSDEDNIRAQLSQQQADWNSGDLDAFMKVYWKSEQLTFASGGKITRGWQATLDGYKAKYSSKEKLGKLTFGDLEFQRLDDSIMLVLGTWHLDREDSIGGNFSLVWKKFDDVWLIVHDHTSAKETPH